MIARPSLRSVIGALAAAVAAIYPAAAGQLPNGFVYLRDLDPTIMQEIRYFGAHNFLGRRVAGYEAPECILTAPAAKALIAVQARLRRSNLSLKVYDCYRPARAVEDFLAWAREAGDHGNKSEFYPVLDKSDLFARQYIASPSAHSRGSAVDLTIVPLPARPQPEFRPGEALHRCDLPAGQRYPDNSLDFGTGFDCFSELSHTVHPKIAAEARANRRLLVTEMARAGFQNYRREWWHYELKNEPIPNTYFDFPISPSRLRVVCVAADETVPVRDRPSLGARIIAALPADTPRLGYKVCSGKHGLAEWHAFDAVSRLVEGVYVPWCQVEVPGDDGGVRLSGWVEGRHLAPVGQDVDCR